MSIIHTIEIYLVATILFFLIDVAWLSKVAPRLYKKHIGHLLADKPNGLTAVIFYLIFIVGLTAFVLVPALNASDIGYVLKYAPLFGLVTYSSFDLTSQAVLKKWPTAISVIDITWGVVLTTATSLITYFIAHKWIM